MRKIKKISCIVKSDAGLCNPSSLYFDGKKEELYICDMGNARVVKYFYFSRKLENIYHADQSGETLMKPLALTMDGENHLFVTDVQHNRIFQYRDGNFNGISIDLRIGLPGSITVGEEGCVYISDFHQNRIIKWLPTNKVIVLRNIPCSKMYGIFYKFPYLYITDTGNNRIVRYHTLREELETVINSGISPIAIAVSDETIFFSENRRIFCLFSNGRKLLLLDRKLWVKYDFERLGHIGAIAIGERKRLFFSDTIKNCVYEVILE